jgi:tripartite-type tricarboxylate transporter receptor subunit TctC
LSEGTFEPVGNFLTYPFVIATSADSPYGTMEELAAYAKENKVALGHFGALLVPTKVTLAASKSLDFEFGSDAAFDALDCNTLASGDADVINTTLQLILPCLDKVKILVTITGERINKLPDVPTMAEIVPELNLSLWNGLFVKQGTPKEVKDKIAEIAKAAVLGEKAQKIADDTGALIYWKDAAESAEIIAADSQTFDTINSMLE